MRRAGLVAVGLFAAAAAARGQLVPLARCQAAYPCNVPYGLLPADAAANNAFAQSGHTLLGVGIDGALKPRLVAPPVSTDPSEDAARIYVKKHPLKPTAKPTPPPETPK